jgi:hypothetical protein
MLTDRDKIKNLSHATNILFILSSCIKYPSEYLTSKTLVSMNTNTIRRFVISGLLNLTYDKLTTLWRFLSYVYDCFQSSVLL